jgi:hypothetical protein
MPHQSRCDVLGAGMKGRKDDQCRKRERAQGERSIDYAECPNKALLIPEFLLYVRYLTILSGFLLRGL